MKLTITLFLFMCSLLSYGQIGDRSTTGGPGSISGRLEGPKGTKNPVNADVFLEIEDKIVVQVSTDSSGKFLIAPVNPGIYSVRIVHFDYLAKTISPLPVQAGKSTDLGTVSLAPRPPADTSFALGWIEDGEITTGLKPSRSLSNNVGFAGGELEVELHINVLKYMRKKMIIKELIPRGFDAVELKSTGGDFRVEQNRVIIKFKKYDGPDTLTLKYKLVIPENVKGAFSISGYVFGGKEAYFTTPNEMVLISGEGPKSWNVNLDNTEFTVRQGVRLNPVEGSLID